MQKDVSTTLARAGDGTIQINLTIPFEIIKKTRLEAAKELSENVEVPGFRKGKAPIDKVIEKIPSNTLLERTLTRILPKLIGRAIEKDDLKLAMYPKFDLVKANENEDWQIVANTCELPEVDLGSYKDSVKGVLRSKNLWVPGKTNTNDKKPGKEEAQEEILKTLLDSIKVTIPKILLEEETNTRISRLLERLEKLGLSLDSYLASINKTAESLRSEYENQSRESISIELILNKIAEEEKINIDQKEIESALKASSADNGLHKELDSPDKRKLLESILRRRKALDFLANLPK